MSSRAKRRTSEIACNPRMRPGTSGSRPARRARCRPGHARGSARGGRRPAGACARLAGPCCRRRWGGRPTREQTDAAGAVAADVVAEGPGQEDARGREAASVQKQIEARRHGSLGELKLADVGLGQERPGRPAGSISGRRSSGRWARPSPGRAPRPRRRPGRCRRARAGAAADHGAVDRAVAKRRPGRSPRRRHACPCRSARPRTPGPAAVEAQRIRSRLPTAISPLVPRSSRAPGSLASARPVATRPASRSLPTKPPTQGKKAGRVAQLERPAQLLRFKLLWRRSSATGTEPRPAARRSVR